MQRPRQGPVVGPGARERPAGQEDHRVPVRQVGPQGLDVPGPGGAGVVHPAHRVARPASRRGAHGGGDGPRRRSEPPRPRQGPQRPSRAPVHARLEAAALGAQGLGEGAHGPRATRARGEGGRGLPQQEAGGQDGGGPAGGGVALDQGEGVAGAREGAHAQPRADHARARRRSRGRHGSSAFHAVGEGRQYLAERARARIRRDPPRRPVAPAAGDGPPVRRRGRRRWTRSASRRRSAS